MGLWAYIVPYLHQPSTYTNPKEIPEFTNTKLCRQHYHYVINRSRDNQILNETHKLIDKLKLKLNLNKYEFIIPFNSRPIIDEITNYSIQQTTDAKYLG